MGSQALKISSLLAAILIFSLLFFLSSQPPKSLNAELASQGISIELPSAFQTFEKEEFDVEGMRITKFSSIGASAGEKILIELRRPYVFEQFSALAKNRIVLISSQYASTVSPYPGQLTNIIACEANWKPQITAEESLFYLSAFTNKNYNFGACEEANAYFFSQLGYGYLAKSQIFFSVQAFLSLENKNQLSGLLPQLREMIKSYSIPENKAPL